MFLQPIMEELAVDIVLSRAEHGEALLQMLSLHLPDILFLDLLMPRKNGMDALKQIRQDERYDNLPVVVLSSMQRQDNIAFCYDHGADRYIAKGITVNGLKTKLQEIFNTTWSPGKRTRSFEEFTSCL